MLALMGICALTFGVASASARSTTISSFDGTQIKLNFFPTGDVKSKRR